MSLRSGGAATSASAVHLDQPVVDARGRLLGRIAAVVTRHGQLRRIGVEDCGGSGRRVRFVAAGHVRVRGDEVVVPMEPEPDAGGRTTGRALTGR